MDIRAFKRAVITRKLIPIDFIVDMIQMHIFDRTVKVKIPSNSYSKGQEIKSIGNNIKKSIFFSVLF